MMPVGVKLSGGQAKKILFVCDVCHKEILNKISVDDDYDEVVKLVVIP